MVSTSKPWYEVWPEAATPTKRLKKSIKEEVKTDIFTYRLHQISPNIRVLGPYITSYIKVKVQCEKGHVWEATPNMLLVRGTNCKDCQNTKMTKTHEDFVKEVQAIHPGWEILSEYKGAKFLVKVKCYQGHILEILANSVLAGKECSVCSASNIKRTSEQFVLELEKQNREIRALSEYTAINDAMTFQCIPCSFKWQARAGHVLHGGTGCPRCANHVSDTLYILVEPSSGLYKIGITAHIKQRLRNIGSCTLIYYWDVGTGKAYPIERELHTIFGNKRTTSLLAKSGNTEFFTLDKQDLVEINKIMEGYKRYDHFQ